MIIVIIGSSYGNITTIGNNAFENCSSLETIVLGNVTTIGEEAFKGCVNLEFIRVPSTTVVPENITDNENTVIEYVYNNVTYRINDDGKTVSAINFVFGELPETVIINDKTYYVVTDDTQEIIGISCNVTPETGYAKEKTILNIGVTVRNTELKSITLNDESIELTDGTAKIGIRNNGEYTIKAVSTSDKEYTKKVTISNIIKLKEIRVKNTSEVKRDYIEGQNFDRTGLKVEAVYVIDSTEQTTNETTDEIIEEITNYIIPDGNNLTVGKTNVTISYTENGITQTTTQDITVMKKEEKEELIIDIKTFEVEEEKEVKYIAKIMPNTSIVSVKDNIQTNGTIEIYDRKGEMIINEEKLIATGMEIVIKRSNEEKRYKVVVKGDITGDGKFNIADLTKLSRHIAEIDIMTKREYLKASDVYEKDGKMRNIHGLSKNVKSIGRNRQFVKKF